MLAAFGTARSRSLRRLIRRFPQLVPRCQAANQSLSVAPAAWPSQARFCSASLGALQKFILSSSVAENEFLPLRLRSAQSFCHNSASAFATASALRQSGFATAAPPLQPNFRAASRRLRLPSVGRCARRMRFIVRPTRLTASCLQECASISFLDSGSPSGASPSAAPGFRFTARADLRSMVGRLSAGCFLSSLRSRFVPPFKVGESGFFCYCLHSIMTSHGCRLRRIKNRP